MSYAAPVKGNRMVYGGYLMRSNLEVKLAVALDAHRVTWRYEAEEIELPNGRRYHPDFTIVNDPLNVVDAELIEVKDRKHVWRCAETLGLGANGNEVNWRWTAPKRVSDLDLTTEWWRALHKPILAAAIGRRVLVAGATTVNAAVILIGAGGLVSSRRHHPLMSRVYTTVSVRGSATASNEKILHAADWVRKASHSPWITDKGTHWVDDATMDVPLHRIQEILRIAQDAADAEEAAA